METKIFEVEEKKINVKVDTDNKQVWLSQKDMSELFNQSVNNVTKHIKSFKNDPTCEKYSHVEVTFEQVAQNGKTYQIKHYNLEVILYVGYKCNVTMATSFKEWVDTLFKDNNDISITKNWLNGANNYEIVKFESGEISIDVNVSPNEETVWLSVIDMSILFDRDSKTIYTHIKNIFDENELDEKSNSCFLRIANSDKLVKHYNIDVVLSVGYRVKSQRGIEFRRWATSVLKQYLIKGYAINNKRCMEHSDIIINLTNDLKAFKDEVTMRLDDHDRKLANINASEVLTKDTLIYEGEVYKTYSFIRNLLLNAKNRVIIVDGYVDSSVLDILDDIKVDITIYTYPGAPLRNIDIDKFSLNHKLTVIKQTYLHSRYIIQDDEIYMISESIKDAGKKRFVCFKSQDLTVDGLLNK